MLPRPHLLQFLLVVHEPVQRIHLLFQPLGHFLEHLCETIRVLQVVPYAVQVIVRVVSVLVEDGLVHQERVHLGTREIPLADLLVREEHLLVDIRQGILRDDPGTLAGGHGDEDKDDMEETLH